MSNVFEEQPEQQEPHQQPYDGAYPPPNRACYVCGCGTESGISAAR